MPGDLDYGTDGRASFFAVGESAWHREGTLLDEAPDLDEALQLANLDYQVVKVPAYRAGAPPGGGFPVESEDTYFTIRTRIGMSRSGSWVESTSRSRIGTRSRESDRSWRRGSSNLKRAESSVPVPTPGSWPVST